MRTCFKHPSLSPDSKEGRLGKSQKYSKEHRQWQTPERGLEGEETNRWVISELMTKHSYQLWHWHSGAQNMDPNVRLESKLGDLKRLQGSGHTAALGKQVGNSHQIVQLQGLKERHDKEK